MPNNPTTEARRPVSKKTVYAAADFIRGEEGYPRRLRDNLYSLARAKATAIAAADILSDPALRKYLKEHDSNPDPLTADEADYCAQWGACVAEELKNHPMADHHLVIRLFDRWDCKKLDDEFEPIGG